MNKKFLILIILLGVFAGIWNSLKISPAVADVPRGEITDSTASVIQSEIEEDDLFSFGSIIGGTYKNEFFGFACTLDDNWHYSSDDELESLQKEAKAYITSGDNEAFKKFIESANGPIKDMRAVRASSDAYSSVAVSFTYVGTLFNEHEMAENIAHLIFDTNGTENKVESVNFLGQNHPALYSQETENSIDIYQYQMIYAINDYCVYVTVITAFEDYAKDIFSLFYTIE